MSKKKEDIEMARENNYRDRRFDELREEWPYASEDALYEIINEEIENGEHLEF